MKLFVYQTPESVPQGDLPDCAIAVDVLRATTTIATALDAGAEAIQAFSDLDALMEASLHWEAPKRIRIGERGGKKVAGFDLGNSPIDCCPERVQGKRIFMSTTNGTRALASIQNAPTVITAAFLNRARVVQHLLETQPSTVWIVGSGWEGAFSLEDTTCAGAIALHVIEKLQVPLESCAGNDETFAAIALYQQYDQDLLCMAKRSSHGQRMLGLNLLPDIEYCMKQDTLNVLPMQSEPGVLVRA
ncbi:2-phosphosulfolactate phosphatase family protein [Lyngbya confervoides]|uniref:Probable 2-phosphosulfolactate phosphatase n=1 Tax=Lyngbya confervoides BDU141951 TaxID=1574623 RepID=A0ABD4SYN1_9CYAN|nr:2-phosphosulfolactate phosphatase family protein [Lyngbya confervoides]MCM1981373.1 2-phosphosulfolactate phosphatase family protein [Lyngbya confervoides BDU141951]